ELPGSQHRRSQPAGAGDRRLPDDRSVAAKPMNGFEAAEAPRPGRLGVYPPVTVAEKRRRLRALLDASDIVVAPGAYDAVSAAAIERAGFPVVHATGAGISCSLGYPDIGLLGMREVADQVQRMVDVT